MEILQGVWKQHLRPRAVVGYGVKIFLPSPPNYVTRLPGKIFILHAVSFVVESILKKIFNTFLFTPENTGGVLWFAF